MENSETEKTILKVEMILTIDGRFKCKADGKNIFVDDKEINRKMVELSFEVAKKIKDEIRIMMEKEEE